MRLRVTRAEAAWQQRRLRSRSSWPPTSSGAACGRRRPPRRSPPVPGTRPTERGAALRVRTCPVADGGDGLVEAALAAGFTAHERTVTGPTGDAVGARFATGTDPVTAGRWPSSSSPPRRGSPCSPAADPRRARPAPRHPRHGRAVRRRPRLRGGAGAARPGRQRRYRRRHRHRGRAGRPLPRRVGSRAPARRGRAAPTSTGSTSRPWTRGSRPSRSSRPATSTTR